MEKFVPKTYINHACQNITSVENEIRLLLEKASYIFNKIRFLFLLIFINKQRKIPEVGWSDDRIEFFLKHLSLMDSNNSNLICGLGEREGRIFSKLVANRNYCEYSIMEKIQIR